ncbi:MAG: hypothetical protein PHS57_00430 [Alphaproteobacteria bacterium]|nr:hypothetical protein [Alphaproteobacteria bacterium]
MKIVVRSLVEGHEALTVLHVRQILGWIASKKDNFGESGPRKPPFVPVCCPITCY